MTPKVSIIIPCYKSEEHIRQCVDSMLAQTFADWEAIFVIDDAWRESKETYDIIESYRHEGNKNFIIIASNQKSNPAVARNKGIRNSMGKYIALLDADDWWEPTKIEKMVGVMDHTKNDWVTSYCYFDYGNRREVFTLYPAKTRWVAGTAWSMFRKSYLKSIEQKWGYVFHESMNRADDMDIALRIRGGNSFMIPEPLSHYRINKDGLTANTNLKETTREMVLIALRNRAWDWLPYFLYDYSMVFLK